MKPTTAFNLVTDAQEKEILIEDEKKKNKFKKEKKALSGVINHGMLTYIDRPTANLIKYADNFAKLSDDIAYKMGSEYINKYECYAKEADLTDYLYEPKAKTDFGKMYRNQNRIRHMATSMRQSLTNSTFKPTNMHIKSKQ